MSIKKSLQDSKAEILKNLPPEFHADFEKNLESVEENVKLTAEQVVEAVKKELPTEFSGDAENIENEINATSSAASEEEKQREIDAVLPEEVKQELKNS